MTHNSAKESIPTSPSPLQPGHLKGLNSRQWEGYGQIPIEIRDTDCRPDRIHVYVLALAAKMAKCKPVLHSRLPRIPTISTPSCGIVCFPFAGVCDCLDQILSACFHHWPWSSFRRHGCELCCYFSNYSPARLPPNSNWRRNVRCLLPDGWLSSSNEMRLQMQFYIFHKKAFYLSTPGPVRKRRLQNSGLWL